MGRISKAVLYGHQLFWSLERDRLDAHFLRFGSGFLTPNNVREALESNAKINQILTQYQMILGSHNYTPPPSEPLHLPVSEAQRSVPIYAHSKGDGNLS